MASRGALRRPADNIKQREGFLSPRHDAQDFGSPQSLSVLSHAPDTTRRPSGEMATPRTYDEARSSKQYRDAATHGSSALAASPRIAGRHVPDLERLSHDADTTRRPSGNTATINSRRSQIITKVQRTPQRTLEECPFSVARTRRSPSHTLSVLSHDPDTTRARPETRQRHGPTTKPDHHQSTADAATHATSALSASPRIRLATSHTLSVKHVRRRHDAAARPETRQRSRPTTKTSSQKYSGRRAHAPGVPSPASPRTSPVATSHTLACRRPLTQTRRAARPETRQRS